MLKLSTSPLAAKIDHGLQGLVQEWGLYPMAFDPSEDRISYGPPGALMASIEPLLKLDAPNALVLEERPAAQPRAAAKQDAAAGRIAKAVQSFEQLLTTTHRLPFGPAEAIPLGPLGSRSARQILSDLKGGRSKGKLTTDKLAEFSARLCTIALPAGTPTSDFRFLGAALLVGCERKDPSSRRNQAASAFVHASRLFQKEQRYGAAALAAEWGLASFIGDPKEFRDLCDGGGMWVQSLRHAPRSSRPAEAFYHGLCYAFRTGDEEAASHLFDCFAAWYKGQKQPVDAGRSLVRAAATLYPTAVEDDMGTKAFDRVRKQLAGARDQLMKVEGQKEATLALEELLKTAADLAIAAYLAE
jgi:hypothetical protein